MIAEPINHIILDKRGIAYINGTRIKVRHIAIERNVWKKSQEAIQMDFPHLSLGQIYSAIAYYCDNQKQIDAEILEEERFTEQLRSQQSSPLNRMALIARLQKLDASVDVKFPSSAITAERTTYANRYSAS